MADPDAADIFRPRVSLAAWARRASVEKRLEGLALPPVPAALVVWSITRGSLRVAPDSTRIRLRPGGVVAVECTCAGAGEGRTLGVSGGVVTCAAGDSVGACELRLEVPLSKLRDGRTLRPAPDGEQVSARNRLAERLGGGPGWVRANLPDEAVQRLRDWVDAGALSIEGSSLLLRVDGSKGVRARCACEDADTCVLVADDRSIRCAGSGKRCALTLQIPHGNWWLTTL